MTTNPHLGCLWRMVLLASMCLLASCAGPRLKLLERPLGDVEPASALTNAHELTKGTSHILREERMVRLYRSSPSEVIQRLNERYKQKPCDHNRIALAEIISDTGGQLTKAHPIEAIGYYLDVARLCQQPSLASLDDQSASPDHELYNHCVDRVARLLRSRGQHGSAPMDAKGPLKSYQLSVVKGRSYVDPEDFDLLLPADQIHLKGIKLKPIRQAGYGLAMVGHCKGTEQRRAADPLMASVGHGYPINGTLQFSGSKATIELRDLMLVTHGNVSGKQVPLAGDYTAALAFLYYERENRVSKLMATLRPSKFEHLTRLYSIEPYRKDKIPLVIVHGLLSSADAWLPFANMLRADPELRSRYQLMFFNYSTGSAIGKNGAELRKALTDFRKHYDPGGTNPNMRRMVILGHSMGGILSNLQIRDSDHEFEQLLFERPIGEVGLDQKARNNIERYILFKANSDITRAIFIAAPHRGSAFAANRVGRFGAWLIRFPFNVAESLLGDVTIVRSMTDTAKQLSQRPSNSVNGLRPDNPILNAILNLKVRPGVKIHSIIAQKDVSKPLIESSDGVVKYSSSHLDGVTSEKVIEGANHRSVVENQETIEEVWRILRLHIGLQK